MNEIVVGVDGSDRGRDAVALGRVRADVYGARLTLACADAYDSPSAIVAYPALGQGEDKEEIVGAAEQAVQEAANSAGGEVDTVTVRASSALRALDRLARERGADLSSSGRRTRERSAGLHPAASPSG